MAQLLYSILNSELFWILLAAWILIGVAWGTKREALINRLRSIVSRPVIFDHDEQPDDVPFYPRTFLERLCNAFRDTLRQPFQSLIQALRAFISRQHPMVYSAEFPLRTFGYLFFLVCLLLFAYADAIAIANGLSTLGLLTGELPPFLLKYEIAVGVATFLSVIIGFLVLSQLFAKRSEITHGSDTEGAWRDIARVICLVIVIIGLTVSVLLGISRLIALGFIEAGTSTEFFVQLGINVLILVNGILAAALTFTEAFKGFVLVIVGAQWLLAALLYVGDYLATIVGSALPFTLDMVWRIVYAVVDIVLYIIFIPFLGILNALMAPFRWIGASRSG